MTEPTYEDVVRYAKVESERLKDALATLGMRAEQVFDALVHLFWSYSKWPKDGAEGRALIKRHRVRRHK